MSRSIEEQEREAAVEREERIASALERIGDALEDRGVSSSPDAVRVEVVGGFLRIELTTGATLEVPLEWFPTLQQASWPARSNHQLVGGGVGIHWPDIDEDLSVSGIIARAMGTRNTAD